MLLLLETLGLVKMRPRLDGRSTIINCQIWVGFASNFGADADVDADTHADVDADTIFSTEEADVDADTIFSAEELAAHSHEELYGGGTSDETISSSQVFFLPSQRLLRQLFLG